MPIKAVRPESSVFLKTVDRQPHGIVHLLGTGKQFKTGTYAQLFEVCSHLRTRPKAFVGVPDVSFLPEELNARVCDTIYDVLPGEIAVIDDVARMHPSRGASDPMLTRYLGTISHKDILVILTGQCSLNYDIAFHRDQSVVFLHKYMDYHGIRAERPHVALHCLMGDKEITRWASTLDVWRGFFTYIPDFQEVLYMPDPAPWYDERLSHSLRDVTVQPKGGKV